MAPSAHHLNRLAWRHSSVYGLLFVFAAVPLTLGLACSDGGSGQASPTPTGATATRPAVDGSQTGTPTESAGGPSTPPEGQTPVTPAKNATATPEPPTGSGGASPLRSNAICSTSRPGTVEASLEWQLAVPPGERQRVDVSFRNNNFLPASFEASGSLSGITSSLTWEGLTELTSYYWRVVTYAGDQLLASEAAGFDTPDCPQPDQRE